MRGRARPHRQPSTAYVGAPDSHAATAGRCVKDGARHGGWAWVIARCGGPSWGRGGARQGAGAAGLGRGDARMAGLEALAGERMLEVRLDGKKKRRGKEKERSGMLCKEWQWWVFLQLHQI